MTSEQIRSFRDLVAWQKAFRLGLEIYSVTRSFPIEERFGLTSQLRRGAVSVASNIAEGFGRGRTQDYIRFLRIARASLYEIETQLEFGVRLGFADEERARLLISDSEEAGRVLAGLIRSLESKI